MKKRKDVIKAVKPQPAYDDERFSHITNNPIFRRVPAQEKRIDVDERFHSMFHDSKFKLNYKTDKRGKPLKTIVDKQLDKYYTAVKDKPIEDEEAESSEEEDVEIKEESVSSDLEDSNSDSENSDNDQLDIKLDNFKSTLSEDIRKKLHSSKIDYARGEHTFAPEESSDEDSSDTEEEVDESLMHEWGEIDKDAPRTDESTRRLALCNMDWDQVRAVDLMILFNSFTPTDGVLKSVNIYPSEFGKERIADEEINGPKELAEVKIEDNSDEDSDNQNADEEGDHYHMERLRKYQLSRLKYYYAVLEFDSAETADKVYDECDGMEYESSATRLDLRFIPDDTTFEDEPKDSCNQLPQADKYKPRLFTTTALQQLKVNLTWDETDPERKEFTEMVFNPKSNIEDEDLMAYLASSSSESEDEVKEEFDINDREELTKTSQKDRLSKYRSLLDSIDEKEKKKKDSAVEMEITWGVGLKKKTEDLLKKKNEEKLAKERTPWEEILAKQKDKRKQKKALKKKGVETEKDSDDSDVDDEDQPFSDDDVDVDLNDDFFKDAIKDDPQLQQKKRSKNSKKEASEEDTNDNKAAALELLMMDDEDNKSHFSLKKIMAENAATEKKKKKKKKGKHDKKPTTPAVKDDFEINVNDERFSALFSSHHFNVDPSDPNYKKTLAMEKIITEKIKRRPQISNNVTSSSDKNTVISQEEEQKDAKRKNEETIMKDKFELQSLVKSIKRKATMQNVVKQKRIK